MIFKPNKKYHVKITAHITPNRIKPNGADTIEGTLLYKPNTGLKEFSFWADEGEKRYDEDRCSYSYCFGETLLPYIKIEETSGDVRPEGKIQILWGINAYTNPPWADRDVVFVKMTPHTYKKDK